MAAGMLRCRACGDEKELDQFYVRTMNGKQYPRRECRDCRKLDVARWRERNADHVWEMSRRARCPLYGITFERFMEMIREQQGLCALCGQPLGRRDQTIDHDHRTGVIRGIVHRACNLVIGNAQDDITLLRSAIAYLSRHGISEN